MTQEMFRLFHAWKLCRPLRKWSLDDFRVEQRTVLRLPLSNSGPSRQRSRRYILTIATEPPVTTDAIHDQRLGDRVAAEKFGFGPVHLQIAHAGRLNILHVPCNSQLPYSDTAMTGAIRSARW